MTAEGSCGHTFKKRWTVPLHFEGKKLRGQPLDDETKTRLADWDVVIVQECLHSLCPDCAAATELQQARSSLDITAGWLQEEPLHPLDGSPRQVSYGETVRCNVFTSTLATAVWSARETIEGSGLTLPVVLAALQNAYPADNWTPGSTANSAQTSHGAAWQLAEQCDEAVASLAPIHPLRNVLIAATRGSAHGSTTAHLNVLVAWLCLKYAWRWWRATFPMPEATFWIARAPFTRRARLEAEGRAPLSTGTVLAAVITSRLHWDNPEDAWAFFTQLQSPRIAATWTDEAPDGTLTGPVALAAIEAALTARRY